MNTLFNNTMYNYFKSTNIRVVPPHWLGMVGAPGHSAVGPNGRSGPAAMESACACSSEELVCKRKTNGSIVWKWFGYKLSDELQNHIICGVCLKTVATKGLQFCP